MGKSIGVIPIDEKMGESGLRQFVNVQRRAINASMKECEWIQVKGMKKKWQKTYNDISISGKTGDVN